MLESVEILRTSRTDLRRAVSVPCSLFADLWDVPVDHVVSDLSPNGAFVHSPLLLDLGDELDIVFRPPRTDALFCSRARVARVALPRRASDTFEPGMGLEFVDLADDDRVALAEMLKGIPPRVPSLRRDTPARSMRPRPSRAPKELVWIDMLLTWEEDLGDRTNFFEVSERIGVDFDALEFRALAPLLTEARPRYAFSAEAA